MIIFFLPPVAAVVLFVFLWQGDYLSRPFVVGALVLVGVGVQLLTPAYSTPWIAAEILTACVAIYLAIRLKLS